MAENFPYLHGFSSEEQTRLRKQAAFGEQFVYRDIDYSDAKKILEVGCGVGAQTEILLRRFPELEIQGIDLNDRQLKAASEFLSSQKHLSGRYKIDKMDASKMDFSGNTFDGAFLCWVLEHVPSPQQVLSEVRRVLRPGSVVYITEVMNATFFLDPYSPNLWKYWMAFNDYQYDQAGDPFIGAKLGNLLQSVGFNNVETKVKTWHLDNRRPDKRKEIIAFWKELLMSGKDQLLQAGFVQSDVVEAAAKEMDSVQRDPNGVFYYSFMQAKAIV